MCRTRKCWPNGTVLKRSILSAQCSKEAFPKLGSKAVCACVLSFDWLVNISVSTLFVLSQWERSGVERGGEWSVVVWWWRRSCNWFPGGPDCARQQVRQCQYKTQPAPAQAVSSPAPPAPPPAEDYHGTTNLWLIGLCSLLPAGYTPGLALVYPEK